VLAQSGAPRRVAEIVLGTPVDVVHSNDAVGRILEWAARREGRTVGVCSVHSLMTARSSSAHADALRAADLVTPDGAPVAWMLRRKGYVNQERVSGPDLMWECCRRAAESGLEMFLYGGTADTLRRLEHNLSVQFPGINVVGSFSPPFRELLPEEDAAVVKMINNSGARIVWIGLGCPKQEAWMLAHRDRLNAVLVGVGAAFDFHAGVVKRAPVWLRQIGLEWLHRMCQDPRRLARRYLATNSRFIIAALRELLSTKGDPGKRSTAGRVS
jgi:N-acetylglucosaminyldiphosphoundecaprenol N-acetyl-beta-D-mannosaminyltransferase